jgi:hypothetical protein
VAEEAGAVEVEGGETGELRSFRRGAGQGDSVLCMGGIMDEAADN